MPRRIRNPLNWLWIVVPPVVILLGGLLVHLIGRGEFVIFGLFGLLNFAVSEILSGRGRRDDPPARAGWVFYPPFRSACARAGRAFAAGFIVLLAMRFVATGPVQAGLGIAMAAAPFVVGVLILVRLIRDTPAVRLTGDGVEARFRRYPWQKLRGVELNGDRWNPRLDLLIEDRRQPVTLRPVHVDGSLLFLMDLIGYYLEHSERRSAIGREDEAQRVHTLLLAARLAAGLAGGPTPIAVGAR